MKNATHHDHQPIPYTKREWRQLKRRQLREVRKAVERFRFGSAFVPGFQDGFKPLLAALEVLELATSSSWWGH